MNDSEMPGRDLYVDFDSGVLDLPDSIIVRHFNDTVRGTFTDNFGRAEKEAKLATEGVIVHLSKFKFGLQYTSSTFRRWPGYSHWTLWNQLQN